MTGALVVLSGGQDSTTCLYDALKRYSKVEAITFFYGQRHQTEIVAAGDIAREADVQWHLADVLSYGKLVKSALTDDAIKVANDGGLGNLPSTFTPGRNLMFLTYAASVAASRGLDNLVTGVCQTDYSGYPDCRSSTIRALEEAIELGLDNDDFCIQTPLMLLSKAQTVVMAKELGEKCWRAIGQTVTCYEGKRPGCGTCPACLLRKKGFEEAGFEDPAIAYSLGQL